MVFDPRGKTAIVGLCSPFGPQNEDDVDVSDQITGSASGFGQNLAFRLAKKGANVVISDVNVPAGEKTVSDIKALYGNVAAFVKADVASRADCIAMFEFAKKTFSTPIQVRTILALPSTRKELTDLLFCRSWSTTLGLRSLRSATSKTLRTPT
jgi:hypothetical protein